MRKVQVAEILAGFNEYWSPRIVGELNGQHVKLVKMNGEFIWHDHPNEDEMFYVLSGDLRMEYRDAAGREHSLLVSPGEFVIVPRATQHRPSASEEVHVMLFEPVTTVNTGNVHSVLTVVDPVNLTES